MPNLVYRSGITVNNSTFAVNNVSIGIPSGLQANDIQLLSVFTYSLATSHLHVTPSGWNLVNTEFNYNHSAVFTRVSVFSRVAGGSETTVNVATDGANAGFQVSRDCWSSANTTSPIQTSTKVVVTNNTNWPTPGITLENAGQELFWAGAWVGPNSDGTGSSAIALSGYTFIQGGFVSFATARKAITTSGASGTQTGTTATVSYGSAVLVALRNDPVISPTTGTANINLGTLKTAESYIPEARTALNWPSNGAGTVRFLFDTPAYIVPLTLIWKINPKQQTGYYTTFFWAENSFAVFDDDVKKKPYFGCHPYPVAPTGSSGTVHNWEVSSEGNDEIVDENGNNTTVTKGQWYEQAAISTQIGPELNVNFYWNLSVNSNRLINYITSTQVFDDLAGFTPPGYIDEALTFGDAPWNPNGEMLSGYFRGLQIYAGALTLTQINALRVCETNAEAISVAAGLGLTPWYININPIPTDITDKSGHGNNPTWVGANRPTLFALPDTAVFNKTLGTLTVQATGTATSTGVSGSANINLGILTLNSTGAAAAAVLSGNINLGILTANAVGGAETGNLQANINLGILTLNAIAETRVEGQANINLGTLTLFSTTESGNFASADINLGILALDSVATLTSILSGTLNLDALQLISSGGAILPTSGTAIINLGILRLSASDFVSGGGVEMIPEILQTKTELIQIGVLTPLFINVVHAIPNVRVIATGGALQYGPTFDGPFNSFSSGSEIKAGFMKAVANTEIYLKRVSMKK